MHTYSSIILCFLLCLLATIQTQEDVTSLTGTDLKSTSKPSGAEISTSVLVGNNHSEAATEPATKAADGTTPTYKTTSEYIYKQVTDVPWSDLKGLSVFFTCTFQCGLT